jgi:hypothetical protein
MSRPDANAKTYYGGTNLAHAQYDSQKWGYMPAPPPSLNGGLYTGKPFDSDSPWRNFPVTPDAAVYTHINLRSAGPNPEAHYQYPGFTRPGNNLLMAPGMDFYNEDTHAIRCVTLSEKDTPAPNDYFGSCGAALVPEAPKFNK